MVIERAEEATEELVESIRYLLPFLSPSAPAPTASEVAEITSSPATTVFVARDGKNGPIVGTLTLAMFRIPSGLRAWIEDVIVAETSRGQGCGEALTKAALDCARSAGARTVDLTSRPAREAANRLYQRMGFSLRDSNVYRYEVLA
ncbi:MAG: GNAT family N-acetyltransferase [Acidimicrobiales bacterium]